MFAPHILHSPHPSSTAPVTSPPPVPNISGKKAQCGLTPTASSPPHDGRPHPPVRSDSFTSDPGDSLVLNKARGQAAYGRNGVPPTSTPRALVSQGKLVAISPTKTSSSQCSSSPVEGSCSGQNWRERDSGLSQSLLPDAGGNHSEELEKLLEECRTTLGITSTQDTAMNTTGKSFISLNV